MEKNLLKKIKLISFVVICLLFVTSMQSLIGETIPTIKAEGRDVTPTILIGRGENITYNVGLKHGWNLISLPINQSIHKNDIIIRNNSIEYNWTEAVSNLIVIEFIYWYNAAIQFYDFTDILSPGMGYWVYAYYDCELLVEGLGPGDGDCYWNQNGNDIYYNAGNVGITYFSNDRMISNSNGKYWEPIVDNTLK